MDMYKQASRINLTFITSKGILPVNQLWDLNQTELTASIKNVKKTLKKSDDDDLDFLDATKIVDVENQLRFDILKDIYLTNKDENEKVRTEKERKENNQKIMELIQRKKEGELENKSVEELEAMLK